MHIEYVQISILTHLTSMQHVKFWLLAQASVQPAYFCCLCMLCAICLPSMQECKALNARLIRYLKGRDAVHKLVSFVIEPAKTWASERQQQRFPFIACEVSFESSGQPQSACKTQNAIRGYRTKFLLQTVRYRFCIHTRASGISTLVFLVYCCHVLL